MSNNSCSVCVRVRVQERAKPPSSSLTVGYKKKKHITPNNNNNNNNNKQVSLPKIPGTQTGGGGGSPLAGSPGHGLDGGIGGRVKQGEPVGLRNYDPKNPLTVELQVRGEG